MGTFEVQLGEDWFMVTELPSDLDYSPGINPFGVTCEHVLESNDGVAALMRAKKEHKECD
jgi:hypothetical protein